MEEVEETTGSMGPGRRGGPCIDAAKFMQFHVALQYAIEAFDADVRCVPRSPAK